MKIETFKSLLALAVENNSLLLTNLSMLIEIKAKIENRDISEIDKEIQKKVKVNIEKSLSSLVEHKKTKTGIIASV